MKHVRTTSGEAYRAITPSLSHREQIVFSALQGWRGDAPTSYELTEALKQQQQAFDVNSTRPRLTRLQQKQIVATGEKRTCRITGKTAFTWRVVGPRPARDAEQATLALRP